MFKVKEVADVFVDGCVRGEAGQMLFLSCYGRDTAIQQLFAAFYLKAGEGGLDYFHLVPAQAQRSEEGELVQVGDADRLQKISGRLPRENLFGNLAHTWIYDPAIVTPDRSNRIAWVIEPNAVSRQDRKRISGKVWEVYKLLSPVPLLDHWQRALLKATLDECVRLAEDMGYPPLGRVSAFKVNLPDSFPDTVSSLIKKGRMGLTDARLAA